MSDAVETPIFSFVGIIHSSEMVFRCVVVNHGEMSLVMRKSVFGICENKDAGQLRGNREADQCLCFRYIDSTIPFLSKSEISSL